jgi:GT2 family glycosyltransferase
VKSLSFVIPAHNEEAVIEPTIRAIDDASRRVGVACEVIVVDDESTDRTGALAEALGAHVIRIEARQIAKARNAGAAIATSETLVFVDADTIVSPAVIRGAVDSIAAGAAGGSAEIRADEPAPRYVPILMRLTTIAFRWFGWFGGCFVFCRRDVFQTIGGFDERLFAAEEIAFGRALRRQGRVVILREPVVTSARKLRTHSGWEILWAFTRLALTWPWALTSRRSLGLWYGQRRKDPARSTR